MANAIVKKVKGQGKRSVVRPRVASLVGTLKSIAEFEKKGYWRDHNISYHDK